MEELGPIFEDHLPSSRPKIRRKKKNRLLHNHKDADDDDKEVKDVCLITEPSSFSCSPSYSTQRGTRMAFKRRSPRVRFALARRAEGGVVEAIALPLGMSFAAVVSQVLEKQDATSKRMSADYLSTICTSAVRESLANVFGDKFDCFVRNFEKSFGSTLRTLRLINESSMHKGNRLSNYQNVESSNVSSSNASSCANHSDINVCHSEADSELNTNEDAQENMPTGFINRELALHGQSNQVACVIPSTGSAINQSVARTMEKSVIEQVRSNDLKTLEIGLTMKKLRLKEAHLALNMDSNHLERSKLAMGMSKASFKAEKFKNELEDTRHADLLKKCIDCLVAGLLIMSFSLSYGAYVYSYQRIIEATASCRPSLESTSWWMPKPMSSFNSGLQTFKCQVQVVSQMMFGIFMVLATAYLLLQRSTSKQTMPITFILLLLAIGCGVAGKFCVDTLGGSGYYWLIYWEILCLLHFFSNVWTSILFFILHGPVSVSQGTKSSTLLPYWIRRVLFYTLLLLLLPLLCGLMPFASLSEWKDHFILLVLDFSSTAGD